MAYGAADFAGGAITKRAGVVRVVFLSQLLGTGLTILLVPVMASWPPSAPGLWWGVWLVVLRGCY